jgi:hypothetical protein
VLGLGCAYIHRFLLELFIGNSRQKLQSDSDGSDDAIWSFRLDVKDGDALRISGFQTIK